MFDAADGARAMTNQVSPFAWTGFVFTAAIVVALVAAPLVSLAAQIIA